MKRLLWVAFVVLAAASGCSREASNPGSESGAAKSLRIGLVAKSLGNGFFDAVKKGGDEAAGELGVEMIFTGPTATTAEGQIEIVNSLIAQRVDVIAISANDPDALVPTLKKAAQRGIKVMSYDSAVAREGRSLHLSPSSDPLIGATCAELAASAVPDAKGQIAILSATPTSTNQNTWIAAMKETLPQYPGLELVATVYGDDLADKSYREAVALLKRYPELKAIVAPTSVGIVAAAKAVEDEGAVGKVFVTGLGLPSELAGHVNNNSVKSFAIWNPVDLGYATIQIAAQLAKDPQLGAGSTVAIGRLGQVTFDAEATGPMGKPTIYDKSNVEAVAKLF